MADGKKTFYIEINGIQESVNAVESLNKQLDNLEARIEKLASKSIKVNVDANLDKVNASQDNSGEIKQEVQAQRELNESTKETIRLRAEEFNNIKTGKDSMREFLKIAKELAAQKAIDLGQNDLSTMEGMKQQLKDIKTVMQTLNVESDKFKDYQQQANELNTKLKDIEAGYGQYGRNVGNYANGVAEGMKQLTISVNGTERSFSSAREAAKELGNELKTMAINGEQGTKEYKNLEKTFKQLQSTIQDVGRSSRAMDFVLDSMKGITAIASASKGLSAFFGVDDDKIQQTVQQLLALQTAMQGIEEVQKLMKTEEGIIGWIGKGNSMIDSFVEKLTGAGKAQQTLNTELKAGKTAAEGMAAAETAQATATGAATVATKALSLALKAIGIGLIISAVATLITYWKDIYKWFTDTIPALKNLGKWMDKLSTIAMGVGNAIGRFLLQPLATLVEVIGAVIKGDWGKITGIIEDGFKKATNFTANYHKGIEKATDIHNEKMKEKQKKANEEMLKDEEAKYGQSHKRTQEYLKKQMALTKEGSDEYKELQRKLWEDERKEREENNKKAQQQAKKQAEENKRLAKKLSEEELRAQENINDLRLKLMREGLRKELAQLDENNRKEIEKIRKNGQKVEEQLKLQQQNYQKARKEILEKYNQDTQGIIDETTAKKIQNEIDKIDASLDKLGRKMNVTFNEPRSSLDNLTKKLKEAGMTVNDFMFVGKTEPLRKTSFNEGKFDEYIQQLKQDDKIQKYLIEKWGDDVAEYTTDAIEEAYNKVYSRVIELRREYGDMVEIFSFDENDKPSDIRATLMTSLQIRTEITRGQYKNMLKQEQDFYRQRAEIQKNALDEEEEILTRELNSKIDKEEDNLKELRSAPVIDEKAVKATEDRINALYERLIILCEEYNQKRKKIETDTLKDIASSENKLFEQRFRDYDQYMQKMQKDMSNLPTTNKWGFTDLKGLKSVITEITDATDIMRQYVQNDVDQVNDDFRNGLITEEDKNRILANLSGVLNGIDEIDKQTEEKLKDGKERRKREINEMIQIIGQAATSVIQSIGDINQAAFEKQLEAIERQTDELEKQLDKQRELTEKYKNDVDSIEDELSTARGDRRQHLIDQLNAQMQAQRESLAQEKRMEKEREKLDAKREKLEYDNEMRKWNQSKLTAAINTALAISSAAVNSWPIPAVPMIAAATAMGAAQMAAIIANKPRKYADGGLLQGRSHAQGGIKVLGGHAEVEGGEFITNRRTTAQNSDLLYYINSKKKKLDLSDMIEFYSSKPKKSISGMKRMFADGGELPTLRTDISLNSRLVDTMERYAERPSVVQVVDIINKTDEVKRVQTLAGLS